MGFLLHRLVADAAERRPEAAAVRCGQETLSYGGLHRRSNALAHVLLDAGVRPHDRVAVLLAKGARVPVSFYGVLASGGVLVPIDPAAPAGRAAAVVRESGATCLVTEPGRARMALEMLRRTPEVVSVVGLGAEHAPGGVSWQEIDAATVEGPPGVHLIDLDPAYILHTSGSTGAPKLILHTHRSATAFVEWAAAEYGLQPSDRVTNHSSHHTCFATFDFYAAARAGATTVILPPAELKIPASLSALLEAEQATVWYSVPAALVQLSLRGALETRDLHSLRWVLFAGEQFPVKHLRRLAEQLPGARFSHVYGSTEVNVCTYHHLPRDLGSGEALPIGRACATARTLVVDDTLEPVDDGAPGELLVEGATVMSGYWGDPERTERALVRLPSDDGVERVYFRTGDHVRSSTDGDLVFVARSDFQVKIRGHRVELEEVESALLTLDTVEEAVAVAVPDGEGSSEIRAAVVVRPGAATDGRDLVAGLRELLPSYAVPAGIDLVPTLPRTPTGKVDRNRVRMDLAPQEGRHAH